MAEGQGRRSLELQIFNNTRNITLKFHRGQKSPQLKPWLPPGSSDSCWIFSDPDPLGSQIIERLLVYEAKSFTLAVFISILLELEDLPTVLHLELSLDKTHLHNLDQTFSRMTSGLDPPNFDKTTSSHSEFSGKRDGSLELNAGPYKVTADVSLEPRSLLEIELDERENCVYDLQYLQSPRCGIL